MEHMNLSDKSKEALKSETWKELGEVLREKIVKEFLKVGYANGNKQHDIEVSGTTYKVLEREEITTFYDAFGNTLFDVTNEHLKTEYEQLRQDNSDVAEGENTDLVKDEENSEDCDAEEEKQSEDEKEEALDNDVISEDADKELLVQTAVEVVDSEKEDNRPAKQIAKEKLEKELEAIKDKSFAEPIIGYLLKRCEEDEGLAEDVAQKHKTWDKCFDYVYKQARKQATGNCVAVRDDVVYEWAEDYYHKDDKAEEEAKAKREADAKAKREKTAAERKDAAKKKSSKTTAKASADNGKTGDHTNDGNTKDHSRSKKNGKDMEGQMDLFSMLGI